MELESLNRWKASLIHLGISAAIGLAVVTLMLFVWYPRPYFKAMGGDVLILLLIGVDVVIGPLIALVIFNPKKKGLRFDLSVIAALQLGALAYGCNVMFVARPVYSVYAVDRFETVAANQVDEASLAKAGGEFRSNGGRGRVPPMKARNRDMTVIVDKKTGDVVGIVPVYPW